MYTIESQETIVAQCTPKGAGALALIRVSGAFAFDLINRFVHLASRKHIIDCPTHTIEYGAFVDDQARAIDYALFFLMRAPRTFTGEDTIEISCHNNQFIVDTIIATLVSAGARLAAPGEFSKRAVLHGKIDLVQAEAVHDLITASSGRAMQQSLAQLQGTLSAELARLEKTLVHADVLIQASFEFLDDDAIEFAPQVSALLGESITKTAQLLATHDTQKQIRTGVRIALVGSVNVGKSTLFNALVGDNRAIVSDIAGTTRDAIEAGLYVDGLYWTLIDTAGLRLTNDRIEAEGIRRSREQAHIADIVLLVFDQSRAMTEAENQIYTELLQVYGDRILVIASKHDCAMLTHVIDARAPDYTVSMHDEQSMRILKDALKKRVDLLLHRSDTPFAINARHAKALIAVQEHIKQAQQLLTTERAYELVSVHVRDALQELSQLTGKSVSEATLDAVFHEFCVGK
ncbi:MAG: tRNA uridine-5-carboxymethylaminomethyl(34) synthesis GTPase MnmE [Candidatus Babeliales bacterium]